MIGAKNQPRAGGDFLPKCPTGIPGLDDVTGGGLPMGRPTLVCGGPGCGKTLLAAEFLVRGATRYDEPGVFMAFEETAAELAANVRSLGFDLNDLIARKKLAVDYVYVERSEIDETGEYDLEGLFVRLGHAIDSLGAKRVVLDTLEVLFSGLSNAAVLRAELRRLFRWFKDRRVTVVITGERGDGSLTRYGLEEYVSDCVIALDHRVTEQVSTRRLRVVKYRGSAHGTNEFPFLISGDGITVVPITSAGMDHPASTERVSTGVAAVDGMLGGKGYLRGTSVLVSGTAGTGKTSLAGHFAAAACARGEKCLYFSFEEAQSQLVRNLRSIGLDLEPWLSTGRLRVHSTRPTRYGLEMHLATMYQEVTDFAPQVVVIDPISNFIAAGTTTEAGAMLVRLVDFLKERGVTSLFTNLTHAGSAAEETDTGISSIIDTWLLLRDTERNGERGGVLYVLKSRGMAHSKQVREFRLTDGGIELGKAVPSAVRAEPRSEGGGP
ncbi:circadian clock protein KaiC [Frigoriglobus tundricola]|uniref:non-specific serine/threonine protein kinase n=1 Tax=Frigoriglobus tundricola TaxID=2774151 RepID=A0A6M5YHL0_9BACT|nr:circadian clock protein KaiC [Frigoriglobus tundricola]QJW93545.1 Circadian clock protein KaiC [Frigoriglobus tundricola]